MNKEDCKYCEYYEIEYDYKTYIGEEVSRRVIIGARCNHESYFSGVCQLKLDQGFAPDFISKEEMTI